MSQTCWRRSAVSRRRSPLRRKHWHLPRKTHIQSRCVMVFWVMLLLKIRNYLWMTKSQHCVKRIWLRSIISNVANNKNEKLLSQQVFKNHNCNTFQSSFSVEPVCPSLSPFVHVLCIWQLVLTSSFHVLISYFLVSLKLVAVVTVWSLTISMTQHL